MDPEKYTERARGVIQSAQSLAMRSDHQQFTPLHILKALLDDRGVELPAGRHHAGYDVRGPLHDRQAQILPARQLLAPVVGVTGDLEDVVGADRLDERLLHLV